MFEEVSRIKSFLKTKWCLRSDPYRIFDDYERKAVSKMMNSALFDAFFTLTAKLVLIAFGLLLLYISIGEFYA